MEVYANLNYKFNKKKITLMSRILNIYFELRFRLLQYYWGIFDKDQYNYCDVLMFHHVSDEHVDINESCQCTKSEFRKRLQNRLDLGYEFISVDQLYENLRLKKRGRYCCVTFDDVPHNFITSALPILEELDIPYCLFITTDFMKDKGYLSFNEVKSLCKKSLCTIGAHTVSHPKLRESPDSYGELKRSKETLEGIIGSEVKYLAYPYGRQSSISIKVQKEAKMAGYKIAFSTIPTSINILSKNRLYFLPRILK